MDTVPQRVAKIDRLLHAHAGGLELLAHAGDRIRVRFTGMCTGCPFKAVTTEATVRPLLLELPEVRSVEIEGGRVSEEAQERLRAALGHQECPATVAGVRA